MAGDHDTITDARKAQLVRLLDHDCGACHGLEREGGLGPPLLPEDLRQRSREALVATILNGRPDTAMPPWRPFLTRAEARWLVDYLRAGRSDLSQMTQR